MAGVTAHWTHTDFVLTAKNKGEVGNLIGVKAIIDPAGATGATTVSVGSSSEGIPTITVKLKNTSGTTITATVAEVYAALSGSADVQKLALLTAGSATGANTGAAFTGSGGAFVAGASGAEGASTVVYDDLAGMTGDGWVKMSGNNIDYAERVRADGTIERQAAASVTGATGLVLAAGRTYDRRVRKGKLSPSGF